MSRVVAGKARSHRSLGREFALQYLYQWDLLKHSPSQTPDEFLAAQSSDEHTDGEVLAGAREFARSLVAGVLANHEAIDETIESIAQNWRLARMVVVDRSILRLAAFELAFNESDDRVPPLVAINEAIELAKKYSTDKSPGFVNGILDRVPRGSPSERAAAASAAAIAQAVASAAEPGADAAPEPGGPASALSASPVEPEPAEVAGGELVSEPERAATTVGVVQAGDSTVASGVPVVG